MQGHSLHDSKEESKSAQIPTKLISAKGRVHMGNDVR